MNIQEIKVTEQDIESKIRDQFSHKLSYAAFSSSIKLELWVYPSQLCLDFLTGVASLQGAFDPFLKDTLYDVTRPFIFREIIGCFDGFEVRFCEDLTPDTVAVVKLGAIFETLAKLKV